jgi:hypothetical protein
MTCSDCGPEAEPAGEGLRPQHGADGSFSLFSARFGEGFHGRIGALREAQAKFVRPALLEAAQASSTADCTSAWRRRWGLKRCATGAVSPAGKPA